MPDLLTLSPLDRPGIVELGLDREPTPPAKVLPGPRLRMLAGGDVLDREPEPVLDQAGRPAPAELAALAGLLGLLVLALGLILWPCFAALV